MMKIRMNKWGILLPLVALLLTGCATSFNDGKLQSVTAFPQVYAKKTVYIDLAFTGEFNGEPWTEVDQRNTQYLKRQCIQQISNSGMFEQVVANKQDADLLLYVAVINSREASRSEQILSAWTLVLYPVTSTDAFFLQAIIRDAKTGEQKMIKLQNSVTHKQQLFLGLLAPFFPLTGTLNECQEQLFDNLCMELYKSGLLQ